MQPQGYIHSQGFLDQARYARYQFRRLGAEVTVGKNRLREDSINIIFGAHLGFAPDLKDRYACVFFNLEQLGEGGARVSQEYIRLLSTSAAIDYDERNLAAYGCKPGDVPVVTFGYAPYLASEDPIPLEERPIDLLFFGSMNERRKALIQRIEACGWSVSIFDKPLYGQERDHFIRQSKAVLNCHFYETSRFEQARAFTVLSLGTPMLSEKRHSTTAPAAFERSVEWFDDQTLEQVFSQTFMSSDWMNRVPDQLAEFSRQDDLNVWNILFNYLKGIGEIFDTQIGKKNQKLGKKLRGKMVSVTDLVSHKKIVELDHVWLQKLPESKKILVLDEESACVIEQYAENNSEVCWDFLSSLDVSIVDEENKYDLVVASSRAADPGFGAIIEEIDKYLKLDANIFVCLKNASSVSTINALMECDTTCDDGQDSIMNGRETPAFIYKVLLDAGWMPSAVGSRVDTNVNAVIKQGKFGGKKQNPETNRELLESMERLYIIAKKDFHEMPKLPGNASFTVVVPTTVDKQLKLNVEVSPGLKEVNARVIAIRGATSPADALVEARPHLNSEWILLSHQDVYYPKYFGEKLNHILENIPEQVRRTKIIGFVGMCLDQETQKYMPAGHVIDRIHRSNYTESKFAVSIDELAIILHKDAICEIDSALGWHLWATDLCLKSITDLDVFPEIIKLPLFHNTRSGWILPDDFHDSALEIYEKYQINQINTLCAVIDQNFLFGKASA